MNQEFRHLHMPIDLATEFIAVFSRMEHALKSTNYAIGDENKVDPAWDRFANDIHEQFQSIEDKEIIEAKSYLLSSPPRKQALIRGRVKFQDQAIDVRQRQTQQLLRFVRTVRNNLFHGGKYLPDGEIEEGRNHKLVDASLKILRACISLNNEVRQSYER